MWGDFSGMLERETNMAFRDDILRGLRLGGVALVLLLAILLVRRMVHITAPVESTAPLPTAATQVPESPPEAAPADTSPVPPTPPGRPVPTRAAANRAAILSAASNADPERTAAAAEPPEPLEAGQSPAVQDTSQAPEPVPQNAPVAEAPPADEVHAPQAPESRGKRVIKAVGRFLHLGAKKQ